MLAHVAIALLTQLTGRVLFKNWTAGAFAAATWAIAREITQAEYRWIERFGSGRRANMPWWGGFDPKVWTQADPWLDWLVPCVAVTLVAAAAHPRALERAQ